MVNGIVIKNEDTASTLEIFCSDFKYEILKSLKHWKSIQDLTGVINPNFKFF